jgi:hypothetical protein
MLLIDFGTITLLHRLIQLNLLQTQVHSLQAMFRQVNLLYRRGTGNKKLFQDLVTHLTKQEDHNLGSVFNVCKVEMQRFATFVTSFRWTSYRTLQTYGPAGQLTVYDQTVKRYAIFNEFTIGSPPTSGFTDTGDSITTAEFDGAFNILAQLYASQRAAGAHTQATNYTICHNSCHTSCHRNRGRR